MTASLGANTWPLLPLAEVCEINPRLGERKSISTDLPVSFVPMAAVDETHGHIAVREIRTYQEVAKGYTAFKEGDVLFARITPCMENGKAAIATGLENGMGFGSTEFHVLRCRPTVLPEYVFHFVRREGFRRSAKASFTGTAGQQRVPADFLKGALISVPPLDEQHRIVDILNHAASIRRLREEARAKAREIIPALFVEMFGDPATNPKGWDACIIDDLFAVKGGKRLPKGDAYSERPTQYRYIRGTDIGPNQICEDTLLYLTKAVQSTIARYVVDPGDVVITIAGKIGVAAPVKQSLAGVNLTENAAMLKPKDRTRTDPVFISSMINSEYVQKQIEVLTGRVTIGKLALERAKTLRILLPPLALQQEFAERVAEVEGISTLNDRAATAAEQMAQSLLAQVFGQAA